ncbi:MULTISPECIES: ABC transporter permease [unclassified Dietzia]|uniref:ABC transporter permease n=1 Tax=unclassified Dietzia TaxID=2617939 RepID=UPI000D21FDCE|nr:MULTISPECIES: ABC transporter permease [unclassified Dietzia]AVZ38958.1 ABC transporter permease [Dietzia sp. JS16-p6b]QGW24106.1 ABC transporter permease [Dietzia sp. DQ12-45-1b]
MTPRRAAARIAQTLLTLAVTVVLAFWLVDALPGDAATASYVTTDAAWLARRRAELGLDLPVAERFAEWLAGMLRGDPGLSVSGTPVVDQIREPLARTGLLLLAAIPVAVVAGLGGGVLAGARAGSRTDRATSLTAAAVLATPEFVLAVILVSVLSVRLGLLPPVSLVPLGGSPLDRPQILVLPALTAGLAVGAWLQRTVRAVVAAEAARPHVRAARLAGIPPLAVLVRHLLPGAAGPIVQLCALAVPGLIGAALVVEVAFGYSGAGSLLVTLIANRDTVPVATLVTVAAGVTAASLLLADLTTGGGPQRWLR